MRRKPDSHEMLEPLPLVHLAGDQDVLRASGCWRSLDWSVLVEWEDIDQASIMVSASTRPGERPQPIANLRMYCCGVDVPLADQAQWTAANLLWSRLAETLPESPLMTARIQRRIVPYHRVGGGKAARWSEASKRYHASQDRLWLEILRECPGLPRPLTTSPVRVGTAVFLPPVESGPHKRSLPANKGDWDNYHKAVLDCLVHYDVLVGDHARAVVGPGRVVLPESGEVLESGCYLSDSESLVITVWGARS